jgi:hemoglobin
VKKNILINGLMALALTAVLMGAGIEAFAQTNGDSLYKRLGGYDAIAAVTEDFIGRLATDKKLGRFFVGLSNDSKARVAQHVKDQLCAATGGPCTYTGRDMKTSHKGLGISEEDWDIAVKHLGATLNRFKVGQKEQQDLSAALMTLKADIVER